jgi:hypothetical protein
LRGLFNQVDGIEAGCPEMGLTDEDDPAPFATLRSGIVR